MNNPKIGNFFPLDEKGAILNPTHIDLVPKSLLALLDDIIQLYKSNEAKSLHSIWLRGSTPRGFFTDKYSDLDVFALVKTPNVRWEKAKWSNQVDDKLKKKYGVIPEIEWVLSSWYSNLYVENPRLSFYIKTQSLLLAGEDIRPLLPDFKISDDIKMNSRWLQDDVKTFMEIEEPTKAEIRAIIKVVIRSAFESIMEKEARYTPDLYWCAEAFGRHCPKGKKPIFELLRAYDIKNNDMFYLKENIGKVVRIIILV